MTHQRQPTRTSCGPTCAAMLAGVPVQVMLDRLPNVRLTASRRRLKTHRTNVGEMGRLLAPHGLTIGKRVHGQPPRPWQALLDGRPPSASLALLRIQHASGSGWHWCVHDERGVYDPAEAGLLTALIFFGSVEDGRVSHYPISKGTSR